MKAIIRKRIPNKLALNDNSQHALKNVRHKFFNATRDLARELGSWHTLDWEQIGRI
jgi:hypothetical protein